MPGKGASDLENLQSEFASWGLRRPGAIIDDALTELASIIKDETPLGEAFAPLQEQISAFVDNLQRGTAVGG